MASTGTSFAGFSADDYNTMMGYEALAALLACCFEVHQVEIVFGHATKPFELPAEDPDYHRQLLKSYNVPELMKGPVSISPHTFADVVRQEAVRAHYVAND